MRKAKPKKRVILPDPVFNDTKVSKFVNHLMYDGKKTKSYEIFYNALETVKAKMQNEEKSALEIWKQALDNITPQVEVKSRRIGGATFQVPTEIRPDRKESVSMKNMIQFARKRSGKSNDPAALPGLQRIPLSAPVFCRHILPHKGQCPHRCRRRSVRTVRRACR